MLLRMTAGPRLHELGTFDDQQAVRVVVEATAGRRSKLKYQPALGIFVLQHVLPAGMAFPWDFGFIPSTLGGDGDPLDALVFADESVPTGTIVPCRLIAVLQATQSQPGRPVARNDRFLAVARHGTLYARWRDLDDVPVAMLDQLEHFFVSYNEQRGVTFAPAGRFGAATAMQVLQQGCSRFRGGA